MYNLQVLQQNHRIEHILNLYKIDNNKNVAIQAKSGNNRGHSKKKGTK